MSELKVAKKGLKSPLFAKGHLDLSFPIDKNVTDL